MNKRNWIKKNVALDAMHFTLKERIDKKGNVCNIQEK